MYKARFEDRLFLQGGIEHHQQAGRSLVFLSLSENVPARPYRDSGAALTKFLRDLNACALGGRARSGLPWVAVGEHGEKSGRFHWHLCVAGLMYPWDASKSSLFLSAGLVRAKVGEKRSLLGHVGHVVSKKTTIKPLAVKHGFGSGFIGLKQVGVTGDDVGAVGNYLSKYLSKGSAGHAVDVDTGEISGFELPKGFQLVRASRAASAWWPGHSLMQIREESRSDFRARKRQSRAESAQQIAEQPLTAGLDWQQPTLTIA
jgi:hypothetical protein